MSFALRSAETVEQGVRRLLLKQLHRAQECLKADRVTDAKAIHQARKSLKKSRALFRLVRAELGKSEYQKWNASVRDIARVVSPARDAQVLSATLEHLLAPAHTSKIGKRFLVARASARRLAKETGAAAANRKALSRAQKDLKSLLTETEALSLSHAGWKAISPNLRRVYRQGRQAFATAYRQPTDTAFHEWRKSAKYLRYQIDVLRLCWKAPLEEFSEQLHRLSDLLGEDHDLVVLRDLVRRQPGDFGTKAEAGELYTRISARQEWLRRRAYSLGGKLYAEKAGAFASRLHGYWQQWHRPDLLQ